MRAFDYIFKHHLDDADWFLKADDDTYVIVENLRYMLSGHSPEDPVIFGHHITMLVKQGYFSGGGGYVMSREALRRFGKRQPGLCRDDHGAEDVQIGRCMEKLGVKPGDSRDALNRSRFHCFSPTHHIHGHYPPWYYKYDKYGAKKVIVICNGTCFVWGFYIFLSDNRHDPLWCSKRNRNRNIIMDFCRIVLQNTGT